MKFALAVLSLISLSAFAGSPKCKNEVRSAAEALTKINKPGARINSARTQVVLIDTDDTNAGTIGLTKYTYDVIVGRGAVYQISADQEMGTCDVNKVLRSLDDAVGK